MLHLSPHALPEPRRLPEYAGLDLRSPVPSIQGRVSKIKPVAREHYSCVGCREASCSCSYRSKSFPHERSGHQASGNIFMISFSGIEMILK